MKLWKCPRCEREFARRDQSHSCVVISLDDHFRGKPEKLRAVFNHLLDALRRDGAVRVDAVQSAINLADQFHFAMVYVQRKGLKVEFALDRRVDDRRVIRTQRLSPRRILHFVRVAREDDIDPQLLRWLREAQAAESWHSSPRERPTNG